MSWSEPSGSVPATCAGTSTLLYVVDKIEFRPAVPGHADQSRGYRTRAHGDEERALVAVPFALLTRQARRASAFDEDLLILDVIANIFEDRVDFVPIPIDVANNLFRQGSYRFRGRLHILPAL